MYPVERPKRHPMRVVLWVLLAFLMIFASLYLIFFCYNRFTLSVIPAGDTQIVLEYGETYCDIGAHPYFCGSRFLADGFVPDVPVTTTGSVDSDTLGTYTLTYTADFYIWHATAERTVRIVDTEAPILTLKGEPEQYVLPDAQYLEEGYTAFDNYDGDLSDRVRTETVESGICYIVSDSSGNETRVERIIHYGDPIPPEIILLGESEIELFVGSAYEEPGFTARDNYDGDLTDRVETEGTVNCYRKGTYTLTYEVTDSFHNTTLVFRTVNIVAKPHPERITPDGKVIYLTFDDGPGASTTKLLEVLRKYDAKATFFVTGRGYRDVISKIAADGHTVAIHTNSHDYREIYASEEAYFADLNRVRELIIEQTGKTPNLIRFPGGSSNTVSRFNQGIMTRLTETVEDMGYRYFDWNVDSNDAGGAKNSDEVYENVISGIKGKRIAVVLQHDIKDFSVDAVERIILWGLDNGYRFLSLDVNSPGCEHHVNN